jgi:outer membrane immunogenic protein
MHQSLIKPLLLAACLGGSAGVQATDWGGLYLGLNAGYGRSDAESRSSGAPSYWAGIGGDRQASQTHADSITGRYASHSEGEAYGVQLGYNWQRDSLLIGVEADLQKSGMSGTTELERVTPVQDYPSNPFTTRLAQASSIEAMATLRGRLGYAAGNNWLLYGTAGMAWARVETRLSYSGTVALNPQIVIGGLREQKSSTRMGWVLGGGAEYAWQQGWSARVEYLYFDLGKSRHDFTAYSRSPTGFRAEAAGKATTAWRGSLLRLGLNYSF